MHAHTHAYAYKHTHPKLQLQPFDKTELQPDGQLLRPKNLFLPIFLSQKPMQHYLSMRASHVHCNTLQHTATHCKTLQHTATHCNTLQHTAIVYNALQPTAAYCNTLQHAATHCNTLFRSQYTITSVCERDWVCAYVCGGSVCECNVKEEEEIERKR